MRRARTFVMPALILSILSAGNVPADAVAIQSSVAAGVSSVAHTGNVAGPPRPVPSYRPKAATRPKVTQPAKRLREVVSGRRESARTFELSDGRREVELSTRPLHHRDATGRWQPVDSRVVASGRPGFGHRNAGGTFATWFGDRSDRLVRFELGGRSVQLGVPGSPRRTAPSVDGRRLTFPDVFGSADVRYTVGARQLKEDIVLSGPPAGAEFRFDLDLAGLRAQAFADGSIGFFAVGDPGTMVLRMPRPYMTDSAADRTSPTGTGFSAAVTQSIEHTGGQAQVVVRASEAWLRDAKRTYPVRIDPTIEVVATDSGGGQDAEIISGGAAGLNFGSSFFLDAGSVNDKRRSLLKFDLSAIPPGTEVDSAHLRAHYDMTLDTAGAQAVIEPRPVTAQWDESTVTWNSINTAVGSSMTYNLEQVDDQDDVKVAWAGPWPTYRYPAGTAVGDSVHFNTGAVAGNPFTWTPDITETGDYRVDVWYAAGADRSTAAPYVVTHDGVSTTHTVNQTRTGSQWVTIGTHRFAVGADNKVVLKSVAGKTVVADAVRFVKAGQVVKPAGEISGTHNFSLRSAVQNWVAAPTPAPNYGIVLKLPNAVEGTGTVGPRYLSSEGGRDHTTGGNSDEEAVLPKLIVRYGRQSVDLAEPARVRSNGATLSWVDGTDPGATLEDAPAEYQVHRLVADEQADPYFEPGNATLVATVPKDELTFSDTTAEPGTSYFYRLVVITRAGERAVSRTVHVTTPPPGRVRQTLTGDIADTTLSKLAPTTNQNVFDGLARLSIGNTYASYGVQRAVMRFDTSAIPAGATVLDARMTAWKRAAAVSAPAVEFDLLKLTKGFAETQATWSQAAAGSSWDGGASDGTVLAKASGADAWSARMTWTGAGLGTAVQGWVSDSGSNHGLLLKMADEVGDQHRLELWSGEYSIEPRLRPSLIVEYLDPDAKSFAAPDTPQRMIPNRNYPVRVTVTNKGTAPLESTLRLSYLWKDASGRETGGSTYANLGRTLAPGESAPVDIVLLAPVNSETGNKRQDYTLIWDLQRLDQVWLSTVAGSGVTRLEQTVALEKPQPHDTDVAFTRAYELGFEKFFQYTGVATGAGSSAQANVHNGNLVWSYAPISNPSIGPSTFVRLTYSSLDGTSSQAGYGFSLQASTLTRNGSPLVYDAPKGLVSIIDGDGSSQVWLRNRDGVFESPAGVHLALRQLSGDPQRAWVFTRPDGTKFYFDSAGYQSEVRDPNGNSLTFSYDLGTPKRLRRLTDATGRTTLDLVYDAAGRVQTVTDISGRTLTFGYDTAGKLVTLTDAATGVDAKVFEFAYSTDSTNTNIRLSRVRDPQRPADQHTDFGYIESTTDSWSNGRLETITDRRGKVTRFGYADLNGATVDGMQATVTDANQHASTYTIDDYGRPSTATNAKGQKTSLVWDGDNNVSRLTEANGALTTWMYDWTTGYPESITDPEQNRLSAPKSTTLAYTKSVDADGATIARLRQKTSPEGDSWAFDYDSRGNLTAATDPNGVATTSVPDDFMTTYLYDDARGLLLRKVDANGHATVYSKVDANNQIVVDYDPSGSPRTITDAYGDASLFGYDSRGSVLRVEDANHAVTTQTYDGFGRPRVATVPIEAANNVYASSTAMYDRNDNVIESVAPNDAVTTNVYDAGDLLVESRLPRPATMTEQRRVTNSYDAVGNLMTTVDPIGNATGPVGHTTSYGYDQLDQVTSVTDGRGGVTGYSYDTVGNLVKVVDAVKSATPDPDDYTSRYGYDLGHRRTTVTDAAGHSSRTRYDAAGQVTRSVDAAGNITDYSYDRRGMVTEVRAPYDVGGPGADYHTTGFRYDEVGNRIEVIKPRGMATGLAGDFTEVTEYDALDRPVRSQQPFNSSDAVYKTPANVFYSYDKVGRLTAMSNPTDTATKWWTQYSHFDNGWVRSSTDSFGIRTDYGYNRVGQQTARTLTSAAGTAKREMTWDYDLDGSLNSRGDAAGPAGVSEVLSDNSDQRETTPVGTWPTASTGTGMGFWGYNYQTHAKGTGTNTFSWDLVVPTTGTYEVKVRYPDSYPGAASNAQFTVGHAAGSSVKTVDQRTGGGTWVSVGSYAFGEGVGKSVKLSDAADGVVLADAVMLVRNDTTAERARRDLTYGYDLNGNLKSVDNAKSGASDYGVSYDELNRPTVVTETTGSNTATTGYTYDAVGRPDTVTIDQVAPLKDQFYDYSWDVRGLLSSVVTGASASDPARKTTSYSYENRGLRASQTKGNQNKVVFTWFDDASMASSREFKPDGKSLVAEHLLSYDADGNRVRDAARVLNSDTKALDSSAAAYSYEPRGRVTSVDRSGAGATDESYVYSASSNITSQTIDATTTNFVYDRDRLQKSSVVNGPAAFHNHDPFGRLDTITSAGAVVGRYVYDGFDRIVEQRNGTGTATKTTRSTFDAWDRVATKTDDKAKTTAMSYLGLSSQLLAELDTGTGKQKTAYTFDAQGQRLTQTTDKADGTSEDAWYGYTPRGDVENLTTATGEAKSTYGYTAYGKDRAGTMTGVDKPGVNPEPYNLYRFNAKRWDAASGDYDMGFRSYNPGLNRFTSRDMYNGALADLNLGTDPWNTNRYTYGGGNPITRIELDGHCNMAEEGGGCARADDPTGYQAPRSTIDAARRPADPTVRDQFGRQPVVAPDSETYRRAYSATAQKLVGTGGGQGPELANACSELNKVVAGGGMHISCGLAHTMFANTFGAEMCRQPGMLCDAPSNIWQLAAMAALGIGMGKDGSRGFNSKPTTSTSSMVSGPLWTSTGSKTPAQNALSHFKKHGAEFPHLNNSLEYVGEAQSFLRNPAPGALTRTRANGDVVRYDPQTNIFGVMDASGAPRTYFRPNPATHGYPTNLDYFNAQ